MPPLVMSNIQVRIATGVVLHVSELLTHLRRFQPSLERQVDISRHRNGGRGIPGRENSIHKSPEL